ncbi:uncharacterized protein LOC110979639 [Acanthaster planci]|uniref:Uncharacterized protein LOC110979639 n=1 Tax=Acanthaster planci TaxID=133434 RepID=A0A8B7YFF7_ACAPL|nr:uncharacterized protein LOC110979639 [Acanthaster planci]XP_022091331.1 uncharacterized protein LOC110979639 [Acanthaster planci]XP_022091332.1 uncharacterized protein LOC110979639 [Acanthaster planci]
MGTKVSKQQGLKASKKVAVVTAFNVVKNQAAVKRIAALKLTQAMPKELQKVDLGLPPPKDIKTVADFACMTGTASSGFPIPAFTKTYFSVNAKHGGGTALMLLTDVTTSTFTSELCLIRCGFGGNHFQYTSLSKAGEHSLYKYFRVHTDADGFMSPCLRFGFSRATIVSNLAQMGHCGVFVVYSGPKAKGFSSTATLKTDISVSPGKYGSALLVLCSAAGKKGSQPCNAYFVAFSHEPGKLVAHAITDKNCDDLWSFSCDQGMLEITGPSQSHYGIWRSDDNGDTKPSGKVVHTQTFNGSEKTVLLESLSGYVDYSLLVLCSCSRGVDDMTSSALYLVTVQKWGVRCSFIGGSSRSSERASDWFISEDDNQLVVVGPSAPCRYSFMSNLPEDVTDPQQRCFQNSCLATGFESKYRGGVYINGASITGWVSQMSQVKIMLNGRMIELVEAGQLLEQPDGRLGFQRELSSDENSTGLKLLQVYGMTSDINNQPVSVELEGSPYRIVNQPQGVLYAVNLGGPMYQALNMVVFSGTEVTFKVDNEADGVKCQRKFNCLIDANHNLYNMMTNTNDGFLFSTHNGTHPEFADEMSYDIPVNKSGNLTMKLYSVSNYLKRQIIKINHESYSSEVTQQLNEIPEVVPKYTAKIVSIPFESNGNNINLFFRNSPGHGGCHPAAFMVHDDTYREATPTKEEEAEEMSMKQKLADTLVPLDRTLNLKQMKIAGWSSNLLINPSGETGDLSNWNYSGNWKVSEGGDQTETMFISSHMWCTKYQEVELTEHFSEKHLDSSPEIQVSESFREGCNKGGFYSMTATLMGHDGSVIKRQTTGQQGSIKTSDWIRVCFTFKNYGRGVRSVGIESAAKDDKFWAGHFGAYCSAASIRVKSEVGAASGDNYSDIQPSTGPSFTKELDLMVRGLYEQHQEELTDMQRLMEEMEDRLGTEMDASRQQSGQARSRPVRPSNKTKRKKREIRIFVSSTFKDFKEEREVLIKKAFRELNRICLDRGVFFTYVDLRWGITESQTADGETISICLREIEKCRPYFVCLMGDRYGWSQTQHKPDKLLNKSFNYAIENFKPLEWIEQYRYETSVTKLEIMHAALNDTEANEGRTFFYLREPRISRDDLPPPDDEEEEEEEKKEEAAAGEKSENEKGDTDNDADKKDESTEDEKKKSKKKQETQWHFDRQQQLRQTVESSGMPLRRFSAANEGCELIKKDLVWCVDQDFPPGSELSALQREQEAHQAFAEPRLRIYIGGQEYIQQINAYVQKATRSGEDFVNTPFVILGESGSGKSALVANWTRQFEEENPGIFLFMHFIGSSAESASHLNLLRRLYEEIKQFFGFEMTVPSSQRNLVLELSTWLQMAGKQARVVLVLDALNQLDSGSGAGEEQDLTWIPKELPKNVVMIASTLPGRAMDAVTAAGWPTMRVHPLNINEKLDIVTGYLNLYGKTLNEEQRSLIIDAKQTDNPLYLKSLLDEVRMYGNFFQLTTAIREYLAAGNPGELFVKILDRFEDDFERGIVERPGLVRDATTALWCSHRGLSEQELLQFLQVPSKVWSPFYLSLEENLVNRNGILNFFHDHLRQAVERKYLSTPELKRKAFLALADWFNSQDIDDRYVEEVPHLLAHAKEFKRLQATILNVAVFERLMSTEEGKFQLIKSWQLLGGYEEVEQSYLGVLARSEEWEKSRLKDGLIRAMAGFFTQLGLLKGARLLNERLLSELEARYIGSHATIVYHHTKYEYKTRCNHPDVLDVLISLGTVSIKLGDHNEARKHFHEALERQNMIKTPEQKLQLVKALLGMGSVLILQLKADEAIRFLRRAEELATDVLGPKHHYVAAINGQIGQLYYSQSKLDNAMLLHLWDLKLTQSDVGLNHPRVAAILNNCGLVLDDMNDKMAGEVFQAVLGILIEAYGKDHVDVATVRYNLGLYFLATNMYQRAKYQFDEALRVCELFLEGDHPTIRATKTAMAKLKDFMQ